MDPLAIATITGIAPKLIEEGGIRPIAQSRFLREINKARETNKINPTGLNTTYAVSENYGGFAVAEGGPILGGSKPKYTLARATLRQLWKSMNWTGGVERINDDFLNVVKQDFANQNLSMGELMQKARNRAVKDQVFSTFKEYARLENFFALQGGDNSAIGIVTDVDTGANTVTFDGQTTAMGNRIFNLGMQIEFRSNAGALRNVTADYFSVDQVVTHDVNGVVHFDDVGADLVAGDTAHLRNSYAGLPTGIPEYVDDAGDFKGVTRSDYPDIFESVMIRHVNSPTIAPIHVREQLSFMQSKVGYDVPMKVMLWMNKAQKFNWESFMYNNLLRQVGAERVRLADYAIQEFEWDGYPLNIDVDVPPDSLDVLNMLTWRKIVQTRLQAYRYNSGDIMVNVINSNGEILDARQSTIFSEYNWDCDDARTNSIQSGFAFNYRHI